MRRSNTTPRSKPTITNHTNRHRPEPKAIVHQSPSKPVRSYASPQQKPSRRLILLAMDWKRKKDPPISLAQLSILVNLKQHNLDVINKSWSVNDKNFDIEEVINFAILLADKNTDLALGAYVWHEHHTQTLLRTLKKNNFPGRIILGGPQISYVTQGLESFYPEADIFIRGYAEDALLQLLLASEDKPKIRGIHYAGGPDAGISALADLEQLPSPFLSGLISPQHFIRWETQRGCPFRCAFCQHRESDISMVRRQFSGSRIMQEVAWILAHPIIQDIAVLDPIFNSGPHYLSILKKFIEGKYSGKIALQCRIEMVSDEFLDTIEKLNLTAHVVLEFGLQTIHREEAKVIQRPNNMKKVEHVLNETRKRGISTEVSLIFGLPNQTLESFKESVQFCKRLEVPTIYAYPLMLLRGTPLYEKKKELGLIESTDVDLQINRVQEKIPHVVSSPSFTYADWCEMAKIAESLDQYNASQKNHKPIPKMSDTLKHTFWQKDNNENNLKQAMPTNSTSPTIKLIS